MRKSLWLLTLFSTLYANNLTYDSKLSLEKAIEIVTTRCDKLDATFRDKLIEPLK